MKTRRSLGLRKAGLIWRLSAALATVAGAGFALAQGGGAYESGAQVYAGVRKLPAERIEVGGGEIDVHFADSTKPRHDEIIAWVRRSAVALSTYFGRFPVRRLDLLIVSVGGDGVHGGTTYGFDGSVIRVHVGRDTNAKGFSDDWILVHEMVHASLPNVPRRSLWVQEGQAVYVEPIARVQAGLLDSREVWRWALIGMPKGEPADGDLGLDGTHTWGRTYWGGAAFWMRADIAIRRRTHNRIGLQTALRAINRESGGDTAEWSVEQLMATGDAATGGHELGTLYQSLKDQPEPMDLAALFAQLGVAMHADQVMFDDRAPLAGIRQAITAPPSGT